MTKILSLFATMFVLTLGLLVGGAAQAALPAGCYECLSQCPHDVSKGAKACDKGCPGVCSTAQVAEYQDRTKGRISETKCYDCMAACPHLDFETLPCDDGCKAFCDFDGMRKAFVKVNERAAKCAAPAGSTGPAKSGNKVQ